MAASWTIRHGSFLHNGRQSLLYSGEIHYFRIPRKAWRPRLELAKRLGFNTIGFYIPWSWHEPRPGRFDFSGRTHPQRDLIGFLSLLRTCGLHAFARLGPICHGEVLHEGLPEWLLVQHPQIRLRQADGSLHPHWGLISYGHPTFRAFVQQWYGALLPIMRRHTIQRGGPIVLLQLDNEISMLNWVLHAPDYSLPATDGYQAFLRHRYQTLAQLNSLYGTTFPSFESIPQPVGHVETEGWPRCLDWAAFYRTYYAGYYAWLARLVREAGLRLPLVANIPQCYDYNVFGRALPGLMTSSMFRDFAKADARVMFGGAYQLRHVTFENFHDLLLMNEACRMLSSPNVPSMCVELQSGVLHDRPRLYPSDVALTLALCFGGGLQGVNAYMLAGGKNPAGLGARGRYHEWQAAISSRGTLRPHAQALRQAGGWVAVAQESLARSRPLYDEAAYGFYAPYYMTEYASGLMPRRLEYLRDQLFFDGLARLMILAGFRLPFVDLERATSKELARHATLVVFALEFMHRDVQAKLLAYVRQGGRLVLYPTVPTTNEHLEPEPYLMQGLGIRHLTEAPGRFASVGRHEVFLEAALWHIDARPATVVATTQAGKPCAIVKRVGKGRVFVMGFGLTHRFDYQVDLIRRLMGRLGLVPHLDTTPWDVPVLVRTGPQGTLLFVCNPHEEARALSIRLRADRATPLRIPARGTMTIPPRSCRMLPVDLRLTDAIRVRSTTCEVSRLSPRPPFSLTVNLEPGERACLELLMPRSLSVTAQGARMSVRRRDRQVSVELVGTNHSATVLFRRI